MLRLTATGFKAHDFDIELPSRLLLVGDNAVGKSSVIEALQFTILGFVPATGKTPAATAAFLRGREMTVRLTFPNGHTISRTLRRKAKGGFETECRASWLESTKNEEHEAAALEMFGGAAEDVAESLDLQELLKLTPEKRRARLQALIGRGQDADQLAFAICRRWMGILAGVSDDRMAEVADHRTLRPLVPGYGGAPDAVHTGQYACMVEMAGQLPPKVRDVGIAGVLVWANEQKRQAAAGLRTKKQARHELDLRLTELPKPDEDEIARLEEQRAELDRQIGAATEREAAVARQRRVRTEAQAAVIAAEGALKSAQAARAAFDAEADQLPAWRRELAEALASLEGLTAPAPPDFAEVEALEASAEEARVAAAAVTIPDVPDLTALNAAVESAQAALDRATGSPWGRVAAIAAETKATFSEKYRRSWPKVAAKIDAGMDELQALATEHGPGDLSACTAALRDAEAALATAEDAVEDATLARGEAIARQAELDAVAREGREAAAQARAKLTDRYRTERESYDGARRQLEATRDRLRPLVDGFAGRDQATAEAIAAAEQALDAARQRVADLDGVEVGEVAPTGQPTAAALEFERAQVVERLAVLVRVQATRGEFERLVAEITALEAHETVATALEKALQAVRAEEIEHQAEPLLSIMREVLRGAGRAEEPFLLGWKRPQDEEPVAVEALSGGEFVLFGAALAAALLIRRRPQKRLLLLESAEADPMMLAAVMAGVSAVADRLTAAVLCSAHGPAHVPAGWAVKAPGGAAALAA